MLVSRFRDDGIGVTVAELSKALLSRGHTVTIGAFIFDNAPPENVGSLTLPAKARTKPWTLRPSFDLFDIVHHHQSAPLGLSSFWRSVPFISSFHGIPTFSDSHNYAAVVEKIFSLISSRGFENIIAPLACVQEQLEHEYLMPKSKIRIIHPGVNLSLFHAMPDISPRDGPRLVYVGDLVRHKRVHLLIRAVAQCSREMSDSTLTIVGSGHDRSSLEELAKKLGVERVVTFVGRIPNNSLPSVYRSSDLYVTASATEVFGLPLLEAMACGVPVLASPCPAHVEIIEASGGGEIAEPKSPREFADRIMRLYKDRGRCSKNAVAYASEHSWARTGALTETLYLKALSRRNIDV